MTVLKSIAAALALLLPLAAPAATLTGHVKDAGRAAISGAMVTLTSEDGLFAETVYSDANGAFRLETRQSGALMVRARRLGYADTVQPVTLEAGGTATLTLSLRPLISPRAISDSLSASAHFARIRFADPKEEGFFRVECLTCHQIGNALTRTPRSLDRWTAILERMLGFYGIRDRERIDRYAGLLMAAYDGAPLAVRQQDSVAPETFPAKLMEWKIPEGMIAHDVEYHAADGRFYTVDQGADRIYITDPRTNVTETFEIPNGGIPMGGKFLELLNEPNPFSLAVSRGPHSLQEGPDGKFYTTDTVSSQIGVFDPATRTYEGYDIGGAALYPHTLRFDAKGILWFTLGVSNQVGRFDPRSKKMTLIDLPKTSDRPEIPVYMPYGIDIHPKDGSVWYSRLMANRIGRIDARTLEVKEFTPPLIGPRRMRFAKDGTLWIPAYGTGGLARLDTSTMEYRHYPIPPLSEGELDAPYAVGVHPETQEVWITSNMSDRMFRFLPGEERFISYPMPTRGIFLRDVVFTPDGWVCAASSMPLPALNVEGGMQEIICIDPDAGAG